MFKKRKIVSVCLIFVAIFCVCNFVFVDVVRCNESDPTSIFGSVKSGAGIQPLKVENGVVNSSESGYSLPSIVGAFIYILLSLLYTVLIIIIVYAGYLWATASGDSDQVKKAISWMRNGFIGIILGLSIYAITDFVLDRLTGDEAQADLAEVRDIERQQQSAQDINDEFDGVDDPRPFGSETYNSGVEWDAGIWGENEEGESWGQRAGDFFRGLIPKKWWE
jgi:hypothetical protein